MAKATLWKAYLGALEKAGERTPADIRRALGISTRALAAYRSRVPNFIRLELDAERRGRGLPAPTEADYLEAENGVKAPAKDHRSPWDIFLDHLREHDDRIKACRAAGLLWTEVQAQLAIDPAFATAYAGLMEERNIRHEDAINKRGAAGDTAAAKAYLQANDPRYKRRGGDEEPPEEPPAGAEVRSWLAARGGTASAAAKGAERADA